jgi:hypothetical protein
VYLAELRAAMASIHARWEHGHDGLTAGCAICADERAELAALIAVSRPAPRQATDRRNTPA